MRYRVLVLGALLMTAWFALGVVQQDALDAAAGTLTDAHRGVGVRSLTPAQANRARAALGRAALLYPGTRVAMLRADLALDRGQAAQARAELLRLARAHAQDLELWVALAGASADAPATFRLAARHARGLVPLLEAR